MPKDRKQSMVTMNQKTEFQKRKRNSKKEQMKILELRKHVFF